MNKKQIAELSKAITLLGGLEIGEGECELDEAIGLLGGILGEELKDE